ncbi:unnamed protein product [marine sediment metagenome]|uniref:Uncharacterized protein n=1 Tax=marine sediment metagenome TaxID=412755 RepID=X1JGF2_9ZZZZ
MKLKICANCKKRLRQCNVHTLFSGSISGASCVTYLCMKCRNNKTILKKMQHINDLKLYVMDGEMSVSEFNKKVRVL